jgi:hypothetical protein
MPTALAQHLLTRATLPWHAPFHLLTVNHPCSMQARVPLCNTRDEVLALSLSETESHLVLLTCQKTLPELPRVQELFHIIVHDCHFVNALWRSTVVKCVLSGPTMLY